MVVLDKNNKSAFTLTELLVVVVLVGILAVLAMPSFRNAQRRSIDKEAKTNLKIMETALKVRVLEKGFGATCTDNSSCNTTFDLDLPAAGNWLYQATFPSDYRFQATGSKGTSNWELDKGQDEPTPF